MKQLKKLSLCRVINIYLNNVGVKILETGLAINISVYDTLVKLEKNRLQLRYHFTDIEKIIIVRDLNDPCRKYKSRDKKSEWGVGVWKEMNRNFFF